VSDTQEPTEEIVGWLPDPYPRLGAGILGASPGGVTAAHPQTVDHRYVIHYPAHLPRASDPYYKLFEAVHRATKATAKCWIGERVGIEACAGGLELHHGVLEFATVNGVLLSAIQFDHPDLTDDDAVKRWAESTAQLRWICVRHHRGDAGAHVCAHADWEASQYVPGLLG
jgi:hypothetical protein